jgi:hypothetical protein
MAAAMQVMMRMHHAHTMLSGQYYRVLTRLCPALPDWLHSDYGYGGGYYNRGGGMRLYVDVTDLLLYLVGGVGFTPALVGCSMPRSPLPAG